MRQHHMSGGAGHRHESSLPDLRQALVTRRQELLASVRQKWHDLHVQSVETSIEPLGEKGERRALAPDAEVAYELMGSRAHLLKQVDRALEKIDRGSYGQCEDCGEPIAPPRLKALPFAIRCTACQESVERTGVGAGGRGWARNGQRRAP